MVDTQVAASVSSTLDPRDGLWGPFWSDISTGIIVYIDGGQDLTIARTTDKGATQILTEVEAGRVQNVSAWFDKNTPGITGDTVHITWLDGDGVGTGTWKYVTYDVATAALGTIRTLASGLTNDVTALNNITYIVKKKNGDLIAGMRNGTDGPNNQRSSDEWATAGSSNADPWEAGAKDWIRAYPAAVSGSDEDASLLFWDFSANELSVKMLDQSAAAGVGTFTETSILGSVVEDPTHRNFGACVRLANGDIQGAIHSDADSPGDDILTFIVSPTSIAAPGIDTTTANVVTNQPESAGIAVHRDEQAGIVRVAYLKGGTWLSAVDVVFHESTDEMVSWGAEQAYSEAAADDFRLVSAGGTVGDDGGRFQPAFYKDDTTDIWINEPNDVEIEAAPPTPPPPVPAPTASEIADALAGRFGPVSLRLRYQQRDHDFVLQADLSNAVFAASIELDNNRSIVRTARFTIDADAMPVGFDPAQDHIAVILELLVGGAFEPIPMGLFHLDVPREIHESEGRETWEVDASDMTTHLLQNRTEAPYTVAAGTNYITAIETILDLLGLNHNLPAVALTTPVAFTWGPGVPFFDIVRDLAFAINRFTPWPDEQGVFTTIERVDPSGVTPNYSPSTTVEPRMIREPFDKSEDRTRWANRIVSLVDNPLRTPEYALRVNDDPTSPISTVSTGATITEELNGSRVADTPTNEEIVEYEIADRAARAEMALLRTNFDPRRKAHESYEITVETEEVATLWRVDGWQLQLEPEATMGHRLGRARSITQSIEIALGGTILTATEAQIVAGGLTILLTLNDETWESGATFNAERQNIIDGLVSAQSEAGGWNATVVPALGVGDVVRTSATVVTITLPAVGGYSITANETVTSTVPDAAIVGNPSSVTAPTFTITA